MKRPPDVVAATTATTIARHLSNSFIRKRQTPRASWSLETQLCINAFLLFRKKYTKKERKLRAVRSEYEINSWNVDYVRCTESCMQRALRVRKSILYDESGIL